MFESVYLLGNIWCGSLVARCQVYHWTSAQERTVERVSQVCSRFSQRHLRNRLVAIKPSVLGQVSACIQRIEAWRLWTRMWKSMSPDLARSLSASVTGLARVGSLSRLIYFPHGDRACREKFVRSLFFNVSFLRVLVFLTLDKSSGLTADREYFSFSVHRANEKETHQATNDRPFEQPSCIEYE